MANDWKEVECEVNRIINESTEPFDIDTIENVRDFLAFLRDRYPIPMVSRGYWNTILLNWESAARGNLQIEIFGDRLEIYHFEPKFEVWYEPHTAGQRFSPALVAELPPLV